MPIRYGQRSVTTVVIISTNSPTKLSTTDAVVEATKSGIVGKRFSNTASTNHTMVVQRPPAYRRTDHKTPLQSMFPLLPLYTQPYKCLRNGAISNDHMIPMSGNTNVPSKNHPSTPSISCSMISIICTF